MLSHLLGPSYSRRLITGLLCGRQRTQFGTLCVIRRTIYSSRCALWRGNDARWKFFSDSEPWKACSHQSRLPDLIRDLPLRANANELIFGECMCKRVVQGFANVQRTVEWRFSAYVRPTVWPNGSSHRTRARLLFWWLSVRAVTQALSHGRINWDGRCRVGDASVSCFRYLAMYDWCLRDRRARNQASASEGRPNGLCGRRMTVGSTRSRPDDSTFVVVVAI